MAYQYQSGDPLWKQQYPNLNNEQINDIQSRVNSSIGGNSGGFANIAAQANRDVAGGGEISKQTLYQASGGTGSVDAQAPTTANNQVQDQLTQQTQDFTNSLQNRKRDFQNLAQGQASQGLLNANRSTKASMASRGLTGSGAEQQGLAQNASATSQALNNRIQQGNQQFTQAGMEANQAAIQSGLELQQTQQDYMNLAYQTDQAQNAADAAALQQYGQAVGTGVGAFAGTFAGNPGAGAAAGGAAGGALGGAAGRSGQ